MNCGLSTVVWRWSTVSIKVIRIWSLHHPPLQREQPLWCAGMNTSKCMWLNIVSYYCLLGDFPSEVNSVSLSHWIALSRTSEGEAEIKMLFGFFFFRLFFSRKVIWEIYFKQLLLSSWSKALEFQKCVILSRAIIKPDWTQTFHNMCSVKHMLASQNSSPEWTCASRTVVVVVVLWLISLFYFTSQYTFWINVLSHDLLGFLRVWGVWISTWKSRRFDVTMQIKPAELVGRVNKHGSD